MTKLDFPDTPAVGDLYGSAGTMWRWDGARWASATGASSPSGTVAYAQVTVNQTGITATVVTLTGLTVTWTADPSRTYRTTVYTETSSTVATDAAVVNIRNISGTILARGASPQTQANVAEKQILSVVETGLSGTQTRYGTCRRALGTGVIDIIADVTFPSYILVEDITYRL